MRDLILATGLLFMGFVAMCLTISHQPQDYRAALLVSSEKEASLTAALEKALAEKQAQVPVNVPR